MESEMRVEFAEMAVIYEGFKGASEDGKCAK